MILLVLELNIKIFNNDKFFKEELGWCFCDYWLVVYEKKLLLWFKKVKYEIDRNMLYENMWYVIIKWEYEFFNVCYDIIVWFVI